MTAARDAEGQPTVPAPAPRLPAKLAAHPSVQAVLARRKAGDAVSPPAVIDAAWLRELCLTAGADDAAAVSLDHPDLADEREHARSALPGTRTLIALAFRMNRDNCRSPARSVANQEFHQTDEQANHAARSVTQALQDAGHRALNPSVAFPQEMNRFPGRIWVAAHKTVAVAAGLGVMGLHRNVIHPKFGSFVLLATVLVDAEVSEYGQALDYNRSCGLRGSESVQPRAPNGLGRAGPRRTRPRVATRIVCVVRAREASSLTTWPVGYGQRRRGGPEPSSGGAGAPHADAVPGVPGRTITLARSAQGIASLPADDHTIELIRPCVYSLVSSSNRPATTPGQEGNPLRPAGLTRPGVRPTPLSPQARQGSHRRLAASGETPRVPRPRDTYVMSGIHPFRVLRAKPLWIANGVITGVLALLFAVFYVGANIDPADHLTRLPVGLVNADKGAAVGGKQVNLGAQLTGSIKKSTASGDRIDWKVMDEKEMKDELGKGKLFGALVVPADFTSSTTALTRTAPTGTPARPTLTVLTNQSAGSIGSGLARTATTQAAENASLQVGKELTAQIGTAQAKLPAAARVLLTDPAAVTVEDGHPLDSHSGLGMTAFYYALTLVVVGMLSANVISGQVDHALGYTHNDMGPLRLHRPLIRATRVQTLTISGTLMAGLSLLMGTLVMVGAVGIMGMDASHLPLLWLYSVCAIAVSGIGALTLLAAFGTPGMLVVTLVFIGMAVPTADPLLRRPGRRGSDAGLGHDGRRPRGGRTVRPRCTGVVRPQGTAPHPGGDEAREDRRPGVAAGHPGRATTRSGPGVC
ncbi:DUF3533 domain-containing protein, partial [Streptomyces fulvoviolaceus]